jgi:carnitine-CoA ligase
MQGNHPFPGNNLFDRDLSSLNIRDFLAAAVSDTPDAPFVIQGDDSMSYAEFAHRVARAATVWHELGVRKGDRVAFMLDNSPLFLVAWFGLASVGGILVAFNTRWQSEEVSHLLTLTEPRFALIGAAHRKTFLAADPSSAGVGQVLSAGPDSELTDFGALIDGAPAALPRVDLRSDDVISFISTSGTTGRPKAVMQTHGNYVLTGEGYAGWVRLAPSERIYLCLPLFHINSQAYTVMGAIAARATIVLVERFSASRFWPDMVNYRVNVFNFIGSMLAVLLSREPTPDEQRHHVRLAYGGPIPASPPREEIERRFGITLISGIGMSETTYGLMEPLSEPRRQGSLGKPRQHPDPRIVNEARVVNDSGEEVAANEVGELIFRSPVQMIGYFRNPEGTAESIRDGWLHTGDLVRRDGDGFYYFVDRKKDIIRVRGENVSSSEVEALLLRHPSVEEAAIVGVPSPMTDEEIAAFIMLRTGHTSSPDDLIEWCRKHLATFKLPQYVWFVESLPKTETQRVEKHRLREQAVDLLAGSAEGERE